MDWCRSGADGSVTLSVHVQPGARRTELAGLHGAALKVRLAAPPVDGKANAALIAFIAEMLRVPRSRVELISGGASRHKVLRVAAADPVAVADLLARFD